MNFRKFIYDFFSKNDIPCDKMDIQRRAEDFSANFETFSQHAHDDLVRKHKVS